MLPFRFLLLNPVILISGKNKVDVCTASSYTRPAGHNRFSIKRRSAFLKGLSERNTDGDFLIYVVIIFLTETYFRTVFKTQSVKISGSVENWWHRPGTGRLLGRPLPPLFPRRSTAAQGPHRHAAQMHLITCAFRSTRHWRELGG